MAAGAAAGRLPVSAEGWKWNKADTKTYQELIWLLAYNNLEMEGGYPLDYNIFEGSKYEGDTMLPVLREGC